MIVVNSHKDRPLVVQAIRESRVTGNDVFVCVKKSSVNPYWKITKQIDDIEVDGMFYQRMNDTTDDWDLLDVAIRQI